MTLDAAFSDARREIVTPPVPCGRCRHWNPLPRMSWAKFNIGDCEYSPHPLGVTRADRVVDGCEHVEETNA